MINFILILFMSIITLSNGAFAKNIVVVINKYENSRNIYEVLNPNQNSDVHIDFIFSKSGKSRANIALRADSLSCQVHEDILSSFIDCMNTIINKRGNVDLIAVSNGGDDKMEFLVAQLRSAFNLSVGLLEKDAIFFFDKFEMKNKILGTRIRTASMRPATREDGLHLAEQFGFPIVLKPRRSSGSAGIQMLTNKEDLDKISEINPNDYLIETFVNGDLYRLDGYVYQDQVQFVIAHKDSPPCYDYYVHKRPQLENTTLNEEFNRRVEEFAKGVLAAFHYENGVFHLEAILHPALGFHFLEISARPGLAGGGMNMRDFGIDLALQHLLLSAGLKPMPFKHPEKVLWDLMIPIEASQAQWILNNPDLSEIKALRSFLRTEVPSLEMVQQQKANRITLYFASETEQSFASDSKFVMNYLSNYSK